jgi:peptidoglycan/LPS O-acetylase OafA/YrhL
MELLVSKGSRWLAGTILAALAVGPAWLAMMVQPQRPDWACYLFCANPPFALGVLADNTPRIVVNPVAFLAATAAVLGAFYMLFTLLWNRRQSRLAGEIGEKRRLMLKG